MLIRRIAVLITSFNRRDLTLQALASLFRQKGIEDLNLQVYLVDDGCTDGTSEAVRYLYPCVRILKGDGSLYWNGGMRLAFSAAMKEVFDAYILFNDDTTLYEDAVTRLVSCARRSALSANPAIVVGSMRSSLTGQLTYGGYVRRTHGIGHSYENVHPDSREPVSCDTMNANFVLIPAEVVRVVGNLDEKFRHQFGDLDYGLRARNAGHPILVAPGYYGACNVNPTAGSWRDLSASFSKRWQDLTSPKGVPFYEWLIFTRRHYGWRWPYYAISPYVRTICSGAVELATGSRKLLRGNASGPV